jgi:hypothetical protein
LATPPEFFFAAGIASLVIKARNKKVKNRVDLHVCGRNGIEIFGRIKSSTVVLDAESSARTDK